MRKIFHRLVDVSEALGIINKYYELKPRGIEEIDLEHAYRRVLAEDIYAPIDHPPFDRSRVDGYGVKSNDLEGVDELNPVQLRVKGYIGPGYKPEIEIGEGEAVEIATGAMIPRGVDSVVMVEYTERKGDIVTIYRSSVPGENISTTGSDISMGDLVIPRGTLITENIIGLLAGLGVREVKVYSVPSIAVYSVGDEIVSPYNGLVEGKVYDVNGYLVTSSLRALGLDTSYKGILPDDEEIIYHEFKKALEKHDILITSGGTSAGHGDIVYRVFDKLGEPGIIIHGLKIKPGKPTVFAVVDDKLLIGLPGFPLSCYMIFNMLVKPVMYRLLGLTETRVEKIKAIVPYRIKKQLGKTWIMPVALVKTSKGYTAYPVSMDSGSISPLINSDGYMVLPSNKDLVLENSVVDVELFRELNNIPELNIIGSNDYLLYRFIRNAGLLYRARIISIGSSGGWKAVSRGEADIAPTHLLDEETLTYNTPFLDKYGLRGKAVLIRGYDRLIGIIVAKNNPKKIESVRDFLRDDVVIVNRTKGSGTRVYLDYLLKKIAVEENIDFYKLVSMITGYYYEVKTHTAVATAVKQGRADAGLGLGVVAELYGLDFIPLTWEHYDFLILRDRLGKEDVSRFISCLRDHVFMEKLLKPYSKYYRFSRETGYEISG